MNLYIFIKQAFSSIRANKLRSFLSTLWIIIWICSFVVMLSLWEWVKASILENFSGTSNMIKVMKKYSRWWDEDINQSFSNNILTEEIAKEIELKVPWVTKTFPILESFYTESMYNDIYIWWDLKWIKKWFFDYKKVKLLYGVKFTESDYNNKEKKVILWYKNVKSTFWEENPLWKKITIWWEVFIVSWLLEEKNWEFDYSLYIPDTTYKNIFNKDKIQRIEVEVVNEQILENVKKKLDYFLFKKSFISDKNSVSYEIRSNKEELKQAQDIITKFSLLLGWIWAISLIVWWIWIMNIMLVSVTERTREIWIRKAIWATNWNILTQFLVESIILTMIGSIIAIILSYLIVYLIDIFVPNFSPLININIIMISTFVSILMWVLFWLMPAYKAAKLKPIDALHFE